MIKIIIIAINSEKKAIVFTCDYEYSDNYDDYKEEVKSRKRRSCNGGPKEQCQWWIDLQNAAINPDGTVRAGGLIYPPEPLVNDVKTMDEIFKKLDGPKKTR